jgi:hypothetical protein
MIASDATLPLVLCQAGDTLIGIEAWRVAACRAISCATTGPLPPTLAACCGLPDGPRPSQQQLQLRDVPPSVGVASEWQVTISGTLELREVPLTAIHPLPPLLAARSQLRGLRALAWIDQRLVPLLAPAPLTA